MKLFPALVLLMMLQPLAMSQAVQTPATSEATSQATPASPANGPQAQPGSAAQPEPNDPLLEVPPLPKGKVTLVGGSVRGVDYIRNRMTVEPFGGGKMKFVLDERSHIYRDGVETTVLGIKKGDRVYVDSQLDGPKVFARNVRVVTTTALVDAGGQLLAYDRSSGNMTVRDRLTTQPVKFRVTPETKVLRNDQPVALADLRPDSLISVEFSPARESRGVARKITIYALPGEAFAFAGKITHLDLRAGLMAVENLTDGKTYDIGLDPAQAAARDDLALGAEVKVVATFDGPKYTAREITVTQPAASGPDEKKQKDEAKEPRPGDKE